jgi:hypothetical protein
MASKRTTEGAGGPEQDSGPTRKYKSYDVTPEEFVKAWMESDYLDEVEEKLAMPKVIIAARASNYRALGLPLKKLKRRPSKKGLDLNALTKLIEQYEAQSKAQQDSGNPPRPPSKPTPQELEKVKDMVDGDRHKKKR